MAMMSKKTGKGDKPRIKSGDLGEGPREDKERIRVLAEQLREPDETYRRHAAHELGEMGDATAVPELIEALQDDDLAVRARAIQALGNIGDTSALPALVGLLRQEDDSLENWVLHAISDITKCPSSRLLGRDGNWQPRARALQVLENSGSAAISGIVGYLEDENGYLREMAASMLGQRGDAAAVPTLIDSLKDEDEDVRRSAAWALGKIGDKSAALALVEALEREMGLAIIAISHSFSSMGGVAIRPLVRAMERSGVSRREHAANSIIAVIEGCGSIGELDELSVEWDQGVEEINLTHLPELDFKSLYRCVGRIFKAIEDKRARLKEAEKKSQ